MQPMGSMYTTIIADDIRQYGERALQISVACSEMHTKFLSGPAARTQVQGSVENRLARLRWHEERNVLLYEAIEAQADVCVLFVIVS